MPDAFPEVEKVKTKRSLGFRIFKYAGLTILALILLGVIFLLYMNYRLNQEIAELAPEIENKYAERLARLEQYEKKPNAVTEFIKAADVLGGQKIDYPKDYDFGPWSDAWTKEAAFLKTHEKALAEAKRALQIPNGCVIQKEPMAIPNKNLLPMTRLLTYDSLRLEKEGKYADAVRQSLLLVRLGKNLTREANLISALIGCVVMDNNSKVIAGVAHRKKLSKELFKEIIAGLDRERVERESFAAVFENETMLSKKLLLDLSEKDNSALKDLVGEYRSIPVYTRWVVINGIKDCNEYTDAWRKKLANDPVATQKVSLMNMEFSANMRSRLASLMFIAMDMADTTYSRIGFQLSGYQLAVAIEEYRADKGKYPEKLEELVPDYIASIPTDPINKQSFVYQLYQDSYRLYSVGKNGKDESDLPNGGDDIRITSWSFPKKNL